MDDSNDDRIVDVWHANAAPWTDAVRQQRIESRRLVTDRAIVDAIVARNPKSVLDVGCGEGWLCRRLMAHGIETLGVDAVPSLIEAARQAAGQYRELTYAQIAAGRLNRSFVAVVCNFSLLGHEVTNKLVAAVPALLQPGGAFILQTLHPGNQTDGWRAGSWAGVGGEFGEPAPWYLRTMPTWRNLLSRAGLAIESETVPIDPRDGRCASVIFVTTPA